MSKFWTKTLFWQNVIRTLALFGTPTGMAAAYFQTKPFWLIVGALCAVASAMIAIWFTDSDKNGTVDLFEDK